MVEMVRKAQEQLLHYPRRSMGSEVKRMMRQLLGQKAAPKDRFNWPNGLLAKQERYRMLLRSIATGLFTENIKCIIWMMR